MLKLISDEVEPFVPSCEKHAEHPTTFFVKRMGKGQLDRLTVLFERGIKKGKGKDWESFRTAEFQKEIWKKCVFAIENLSDKDGRPMDRIEDPGTILEVYENLPAEPASEVIAFVQNISALDEDEAGNLPSAPGSEPFSPSDGKNGLPGSAATAEPTD
jgi:hypothetical protein